MQYHFPFFPATLHIDYVLPQSTMSCNYEGPAQICNVIRYESRVILVLLIEGFEYEALITPDHPLFDFASLLWDIAESPALIEPDASLGLPYATYEEQLSALLAPTAHVIATVQDETSPGTLELKDVPNWATLYHLDSRHKEIYENM